MKNFDFQWLCSYTFKKNQFVLEQVFLELEDKLRKSCELCESETIALSGGLDSTILAYILKEKNPQAISVITKDFGGSDLIFCQIAARKFNLPLTILKADIASIIKAIKGTISILKNFNDIEIRNNIVTYMAIKWAKDQGLESIITGDGADELFAGYNFLVKKEGSDLEKELKRISSIMHFPTQKIGKSFGIKVESPFLDENIKKLAWELPPNLMVHTENDIKFGKWILRKTFERKIPEKIAWRQKSPMQDGSGTNQLTDFFNGVISDEDYLKKKNKTKKDYDITIRSKESMFYFDIYQKLYRLEQGSNVENRCPYCLFKTKNSKFCRMCGAFPI